MGNNNKKGGKGHKIIEKEKLLWKKTATFNEIELFKIRF